MALSSAEREAAIAVMVDGGAEVRRYAEDSLNALEDAGWTLVPPGHTVSVMRPVGFPESNPLGIGEPVDPRFVMLDPRGPAVTGSFWTYPTLDPEEQFRAAALDVLREALRCWDSGDHNLDRLLAAARLAVS
jgi:hypothetical protein